MVPILAALAVAAAGLAPDEICALARLQKCLNANQLFYDKAYAPAVSRFVGKGRVRYLYRGTLSDQQLDVLGGPGDEPTRLGDLYRFTACRQHSCGEMGAVVLTPDGEIVATGIIHTGCAEPSHPPQCYYHDTLTIFVKDPGRRTAVIDDLSDWARRAVKLNLGPEPSQVQLDAIEIYSVAKGVRTRFRPG